MSREDRKLSRRMLIRLAGAGVATSAFGLSATSWLAASRTEAKQTEDVPTPPGQVRQLVRSPGPGISAPGSVSGILVVADGDLLYVQTKGGERVIRARDASLIWRGGPVPIGALEKGDQLWISGVPLPDGTVAADLIEANVGQARGVVRSTSSSGWVLAGRAGEETRIAFDPSSSLPEVRHGGLIVASSRLAEVSVGDSVQVIGLVMPDGSLRATKVFVAASHRP